MLARTALVLVWLLTFAFVAYAHEEIEEDHQGPYGGGGWTESGGGDPNVVFPSENVTLRSWLTLEELDPNGNPQRASDCWGYTSPSGREYALIGTDTGTAIVEITDPGDAQLVEFIAGPVSTWRDLRTYQHFAYAVSEGGGGIQVFDLSGIDSGVVVNKGNAATSPRPASHNVNVNVASGRLYRSGGGGTGPVLGIRMYDLSDPNVPALIGEWHDRYCHDALAVTWTEAPFAGREIVFCFANDTPSSGNPGVDILDATDPNAITLVGSINLKNPPIFEHPARYSHQGWLSEDRQYLYVNDEVDEAAVGNDTLTRIVDVSDLTDPQQVAPFVNDTTARDHNLFVRGSQIFEANYRSGLRVLQAYTPTQIFEYGYFDTYVADDDAHYNGLWGTYPFFPSGTVIGSDIEMGLFVWTVDNVLIPALPPPALALLAVLLILALRRLA